ncbi:MAG TPA: YbhB/YbcL family Raf kinase inhibitor-like protein [Streptosporangiaceae bacterium]|nr:YbhB/YbcL family Raf kinase inhibitor-like protein [Streptosporangiaceae bacterium]
MGQWLGRSGRAAAAAVVCLVSGCGLVGGPVSLHQDAPDLMTVTSPMVDQGAIAARYTCKSNGGRGESPPISWLDAPPGTKSVALVVDDAAAPISPRVYWIVFDINPATSELQAGALPTGALQARNSKGVTGYEPPCPAGGSHRYRFTVYALNRVLAQPAGTGLREAWQAIAAHAIARGRFVATARP